MKNDDTVKPGGTIQAIVEPSVQPSVQPAGQPTLQVAAEAGAAPSGVPIVQATAEPNAAPVVQQTVQPTVQPTIQPTVQPTPQPLSNGEAPKQQLSVTAQAGTEAEKATPKKPLFTWERSIEILKLVATVWVAVLGSFVTMQYNERQHDLNRIEAIAQMLPHMSKSDDASEPNMGRDGAIWAVFRTANNKRMLRDLAALFPEDIYRVVSSIELSGEATQDRDALVALEVASEKLAAKYSAQPKHADLACRLYNQSLMLKNRDPEDKSPLRVIDLSAEKVISDEPTGDQMSALVKSINDFADAQANIDTIHHWKAKQLYKRAIELGKKSNDEQVMQQVMRADLGLAQIYVSEQLADDAWEYLKHALQLESKMTGKPVKETSSFKALDLDGDGYASLHELGQAVAKAKQRFQRLLVEHADKGANIKD